MGEVLRVFIDKDVQMIFFGVLGMKMMEAGGGRYDYRQGDLS